MSGCNTQYIPIEQIERQNQEICSENNLLNGVHKLRIFSLLSDSGNKKNWSSKRLHFSLTTRILGTCFLTALVKIWYFVVIMMVLIGRLFFSLFKYPNTMSVFEDLSCFPTVEWIQCYKLFQSLLTHLHCTNRCKIVSDSKLHSLQQSVSVMDILLSSLPTPRILWISLYWNQTNVLSCRLLNIILKTLSLV